MKTNGWYWKGLFNKKEDGTYIVNIPTPKGWKCKRKGCKMKYKHRHNTYSDL